MARKDLSVKDAPIGTRMRTAPRTNVERVRSRAKVFVKDYDYDSYIVGIKRSTLFIKKLFVGKRDKQRQTVTAAEIEMEIRGRINEGAYDKELTEGYSRLRAQRTPRRRRGTAAS